MRPAIAANTQARTRFLARHDRGHHLHRPGNGRIKSPSGEKIVDKNERARQSTG
jgi:hypothetical protein